MRFRVDYGCSDGNCAFRMAAPPSERGGMHTNGGCRCIDTRAKQSELMRERIGVRMLVERVRVLEAFVADYMPGTVAKTDTQGSGNGRG